MNYHTRESVNKLKDFIDCYHAPIGMRYNDRLAQDHEIEWSASHFFSKVLFHCELNGRAINRDGVVSFHEEYQRTTGKKVDLQEMFNHHWLREILDEIKIPGSVRYGARAVRKVQDYKHEIKFLVEIPEVDTHKGGKRTPERFASSVKDYESQNGVELNVRWLEEQRLVEFKRDEVSISGKGYYEPIVAHWDQFGFLQELLAKFEKKEDGDASVNQQTLEEIHHLHQTVFPNTPNLDQLVKGGLFEPNGSVYIIHVYNTELPNYLSDLKDEIGAKLWRLYCTETSFHEDHQRMKLWIRKALWWGTWPDVLSHLPSDLKTRFVDTAFSLLLDEQDLNGVDEEVRKLVLDSDRGDVRPVSTLFLWTQIRLNNSNVFELYYSLEELDNASQDDFVSIQQLRSNLSFLLWVVVRGDQEFENVESENGDASVSHFSRVRQLIHEGIKKPFLLWQCVHFIVQDRPAIIPYLLATPSLSSIALVMLDSVPFPSEDILLNHEIRTQVWKKALSLALNAHLLHSRSEFSMVALFVFHVLRQLKKNSYDFKQGRQTERQISEWRERQKLREQSILSIIENAQAQANSVRHSPKEHLWPKILTALFELICDYQPKERYHNGLLRLPISQLDAISWMVRTTNRAKFSEEITGRAGRVIEMATKFQMLYTQAMEREEILKFDYDLKKLMPASPNWAERFERLSSVDWMIPLYQLFGESEFKRFLYPTIKLRSAEHNVDSKNSSNVGRLRTHLAVLLECHSAMSSGQDAFSDQQKWKKIKVQIESRIIELVEEHSQDNPERARVDIFNTHFERPLYAEEVEQIIPRLGKAVNMFDDRNGLIQAISKDRDLTQILLLADWITSKGAKEALIGLVKKNDIEQFLKQSYWLPDLQEVMLKLAHYPELVDQLDKVIEHWDRKILTQKKSTKYQRPLYLALLLRAYHKDDLSALKEVAEPDDDVADIQRELTNNELKQFYQALIKFKTDPQEAFQLFDELHHKRPSNIVIAVNRFASQIKLAQRSDSVEMFRTALDWWLDYELESQKEERYKQPVSLSPTAVGNLLVVYNKLEKFEDADQLYSRVGMSARMQPYVLSQRIEGLTARKQEDIAMQLIDQAAEYHKSSDGSFPQFIYDLRNSVQSDAHIDKLRTHYNAIYNLEPSKLIQVFPTWMNGKENLKEFVVREVCLALDMLLDKIKSIEDIPEEDKYNDLLMILLEARMKQWSWSPKDQSRGGHSAEKKRPGERDIIIECRNEKVVCEAFLFKSKTTLKSHLKKLFNYYHNRQAFIMIAYYKGGQQNFGKRWRLYREQFVPDNDFPRGFKMRTKSVMDVSESFNCQGTAIRVGVSEHGKNTKVYHVCVNLNYDV